MAFKSYEKHTKLLIKDYLAADSIIPYTSVLGGILACKMVYDLTQLVSRFYFKCYPGLTNVKRIEWNNRGISTLHAVFITSMSSYFVFWSNLYSDNHFSGPITSRSVPLSTFALGGGWVLPDFLLCVFMEREYERLVQVSVGYFLADLGMIFWFYPALGGMEYVLHHLLSTVAVAYAMLSGEGQLYAFMVLISEMTTPCINLRWYLDMAGMKRSKAYVINGVVIFFSWLVARILLFIYLFYHIYLHYDQVSQVHRAGLLLIYVVPLVISVMNLMWFWKIIKGLKKTLAKRQ